MKPLADANTLKAQQNAGIALLDVEARVEAMRAVLAGLLQDVRDAERRLEHSRATQLAEARDRLIAEADERLVVEANERLVVAAIRNQSEAETASQALDEVSRIATLDGLTQLPNRAILLDRLGHAIAHAKRHATSLALLFLDLDRFKQVNDTLGHAAGDEVLVEAANGLAAAVRAEDTVSRHGGDEFLILLPHVAGASDAAVVATKILAVLGTPKRIGDHVLRLRASIGISLYPDDGHDAPTLIHRADQAMYQAKAFGSAGFAFCGPGVAADIGVPPRLRPPHQPLVPLDVSRAEDEQRLGQLQEANEQLLLGALDARDLQAAAEAVNRRQAESMTMVVHELRNPIAPIHLATLMLGRIRSDDPGLARAQEIIARQVRQLTHLVDDLLDAGRARTGRLSIAVAEIDLVDVIDEAIEASRPAMDTRMQSLNVSVPARALRLLADRVRLTQVLSNLLNNASKYTPEGGRIGLVVALADDMLTLAVSDNGIGISADVLPRIFEPFVQDTHAAEFSKVGLGVGLTVVDQIVKAHGGRVAASSPGRGQGSEFVVTLPWLPRAPSAPGETDGPAPTASTTERA